MRKKVLRNLLIAVVAATVFYSCKDDSNLTKPLPPSDASFTESFDDYQDAERKGWISITTSSPMGIKWYDVAEEPNFGSVNYVSIYYPTWNQAQFTLDSNQFPNAVFPNRIWEDAYSSQRASNGYTAISAAAAKVFRGTGEPSFFNACSWLVSPQVTIKNGDKVSFYTYSNGLSQMGLYINPKGTLNVGTSIGDNGDFSVNLLTINPTGAWPDAHPERAYPSSWTKFEGIVQGLEAPVKGRIGFKYFLRDQPYFRSSVADPTDVDTFFAQIHRTVAGLDEFSFSSSK